VPDDRVGGGIRDRPPRTRGADEPTPTCPYSWSPTSAMTKARPTVDATVRAPSRRGSPAPPRRRTRTPSRIRPRSGSYRPDLLETQSGDETHRRILVVFTGTVSSQAALERAFELADDTNARVVGLVIGRRLPLAAATVGEVEHARQRGLRRFESARQLALDQAATHAVQLDVRFRHGPFVRALLREANEGKFDLVVIGRERGVSRWLGALRASLLIRRLSCSLLIAS
jgi:nucleotide-binding universal stress UspA family protein